MITLSDSEIRSNHELNNLENNYKWITVKKNTQNIIKHKLVIKMSPSSLIHSYGNNIVIVTPTSHHYNNKQQLCKYYSKNILCPHVNCRFLHTTSSSTISEKNTKCTRVCLSVSKKKECPYGHKCHYAHTPQQLISENCRFGYNCRMVCRKDKWCNKNSNQICTRIHPGEIKNDTYYARVGFASIIKK
jgi:hypothetical protein